MNIRPRTDEERCAYIAGYAAAVNNVADHGLQFARDSLRLIVEVESTVNPNFSVEAVAEIRTEGLS